jgi:hypothetical protein
MRPSKLRLPLSTPPPPDSSLTASATARAAARCCRCRWCSRSPPGGSSALQIRRQPGFGRNNRNHFRARRETGLHPRLDLQAALHGLLREQPAASITEGFDVLVQLVMAAITTAPLSRFPRLADSFRNRGFSGFCARPPNASWKFFFTSGRSTRSCGRFGPAIDGTRRQIQFQRVGINCGSGVSSVRNSPAPWNTPPPARSAAASRLVMRR